ncbi:hypothetical protein ACIPYS_39955 [Kitasatospora sp. NPDC089913]|uniref:hypothetical protein n=1 Tax=Streptomycetaceae TaxID=2062 RepID=UPI00087DF0C5|nr:hypothetical protein [Streptomyces sp. TLI_053]SDT79788.1 hypothetical protein SAMN05216371_6132 [Streptomyces sp. TLI_053]
MEAEIAQLVTTGATTVVGLMATEAWTQLRSRLAGLLGRGRDAEEVSAELEEIRVEVVRADGDAELVGDQAAELRNRIRRALRQDPQAAAELAALLREFAPRQQPGLTVHNEIRGGTFNESVVQAGRADRITYNYQSPPPGRD